MNALEILAKKRVEICEDGVLHKITKCLESPICHHYYPGWLVLFHAYIYLLGKPLDILHNSNGRPSAFIQFPNLKKLHRCKKV